jgi:hypothetical protein
LSGCSTGSTVVVLSDMTATEYDPQQDRWSALPAPPVALSALFCSESRVVGIGGQMSQLTKGAQRWTFIQSPFGVPFPGATVCFWKGDSMLVWNRSDGTGALWRGLSLYRKN